MDDDDNDFFALLQLFYFNILSFYAVSDAVNLFKGYRY